MILKCPILYVLFFLFSSNLLYGQDFVYDHFTVEDGLPSSEVYEVIEDHYGFIWFLTDKGIARYDGYEFQSFSKKDGLSDNIFYECLSKDNKVYLLGSNGTISIIEGDKPTFSAYLYNDSLKDRSTQVPNQFVFDNKDNLFITYLGATGYRQISPSGKIKSEPKRNKIHTDSLYVQLVNKGNSGILFLSDERLQNTTKIKNNSFFRGIKTTLFEASISREPWINLFIQGEDKKIETQHTAIGLGQLSDSTFWVSFYENGVAVYDVNGRLLSKHLTNSSVSDVYQDRNKNLWFSTLNKGVFSTRNAAIKSIDSERLNIVSLNADKNGKLFFTTYEGQLATFDSKEIKFIETNGILKQLSKDKNGNLWYSEAKRFYNLEIGQFVQSSSSSGGYGFEILDDKIMTCNFVSFTEGYFDGTEKTTKIPSKPRDIAMDDDNLYLATNFGLLTRSIEDTSAEFTKYSELEERVTDVEYRNGKLYAATRGRGIKVYKRGSLIYSIESPLIQSDFINKIYFENDNSLWVCSDQGIDLITFNTANKEFEIESIDYSKGIISNEVNDLIVLNDTVWIATNSGLCFFNKNLLKKKLDTKREFLKITGISINDRDVSKQSNTFSYDQNRLAINFSAISLLKKNPINYRFKLIGLTNEWAYTNQRTALFIGLTPGDYKFIVQSSSTSNGWGEAEVSWSFKITPPFWKTWWFICAVSASVVLLIYLFFKFRILLYNRDLVREILRQIMKRLKGESGYIIVKESGKEVKIASSAIYYVKSDGNYLDIYHEGGKTVIREKLGSFLDLVPDPLEYLQVRRSFIIRIDKVEQKGKKELIINGESIQVGKTYLSELDKIQL